MVWSHVYDPFGSSVLSTLVAALPLVVLLGLLAFGGAEGRPAAVAGLAAALAIAIACCGMPADAALAAADAADAGRPEDEVRSHAPA